MYCIGCKLNVGSLSREINHGTLALRGRYEKRILSPMDIKHANGSSAPGQQADAAGPLDFVPVAANPFPAQPQHPRRKKILLILAPLLVLLLAAGGLGTYWLISRQKSPPPTPDTSTVQQATSQTPPPAGAATRSSMVQYVSNGSDLKLSFSYPSAWTVTPATNSNPNDKPITITSPLTSVTSTSSSSVTGRVVITINPGGTSLPELASNKATAAATSSQFAYAKPTAAQHQYPYLTFIHLSGGANPAGAFEEVAITGITAFAKEQTVLPESLTQIDPLITARFYQCSTTSCPPAESAALSITSGTWQSGDLFTQVQAVFASMQMQ